MAGRLEQLLGGEGMHAEVFGQAGDLKAGDLLLRQQAAFFVFHVHGTHGREQFTEKSVHGIHGKTRSSGDFFIPCPSVDSMTVCFISV
jgi:hypothetical protein